MHNARRPAAELVARFRRQRPLRGGSLIVTIFGDAIMPRGGAIALGSLIELSAPFGLNERLVRTAMARLAQAGTLESRRAGKLSEYQLSQSGRVRFAEATRRIYDDSHADWNGRWTLAILAPLRAVQRKELREELLWRGFGEIAPNVFAHPNFDSRPFAPECHKEGGAAKLFLFDADLTQVEPSRLVSLGWNLQELGLRYQRFSQRFQRVRAALQVAASLDEQSCFIVRTLLIHEYRRLHLRDPLLPARLLPVDWPGARAAQLCREIYAAIFPASEEHLSRVGAQLDGPLPGPDPAVLQRFGGLQTIRALRRTSPPALLPRD